MKANELMIGDWVFDKETKRYVQISLNTFRYCSDWERFEPIPLTEDILMENCFVIVQDGDALTIWKQMDDEYGNEIYDITIYGSKGVTRYDTSIRYHDAIRKNIYHVHELQHALILCGLNDIAENFKVPA